MQTILLTKNKMAASPYEKKEDQGCSLSTKCCLFVPLRTGCFILGYSCLVLSLVFLLFNIASVVSIGVYTQGFQYSPYKTDKDGSKLPEEDALDIYMLKLTTIIILLVTCVYIVGFAMNVVLLVGLHRKRPGHIKVQVTVASIRLPLSVVGLIMWPGQSTVIGCLEIVLTAYCIFLYYMYAVRLDREQSPTKDPRESSPENRTISDIVSDVILYYPQNIDKLTLTEKDEKSGIA